MGCFPLFVKKKMNNDMILSPENMKNAIILYPVMGRGHIVPMVELGKFILTHHPSLSIAILISTRPNTTTAEYIATVSTAVPSITFHHLPTIPPTAPSSDHLRLIDRNLHHTLSLISQAYQLKAFILDFFNHFAADVPGRLNIPIYYYFPSAASSLALFLYLPTLQRNATKNSKDFDHLLSIPGLPPISEDDLPDPIRDRHNRRQNYEGFLNISTSMMKSNGIIVNTFDKLETRAFRALSDGFSVPEAHIPPVFCIGPLTSTQDGEGDENGCLSWLNLQPSRSVVFLSFGSQGRLSATQIKEMAVGLERSGQRFLWVVRSPTRYYGKREPSLDELLPRGFLERTKGRGLVVKEWAPQVAILSHDSVGGFVTHCGWNSVLEAVCAGVPMIAWPLYAEQRLNRVVLVEELKVALAVNESGDEFVTATELENRVRELMDSERGKEVRAKILSIRNDATAALNESGSSLVALNKFVDLWK